MLSFGEKPVYLYCGATDMRKSINGLVLLVKGGFEIDPCSASVFVFCNRKRDRIKILEWDADGFWLYFKRLERGHFRWPGVGTDKTMMLTNDELAVLIGCAKLEKKLSRNELPQRCVS